jgi:hypothetical protein
MEMEQTAMQNRMELRAAANQRGQKNKLAEQEARNAKRAADSEMKAQQRNIE